jgi:uncharacterized protein YceK
MRKLIAVAACAVLLSGCVSARSTMLTESTAVVTATGAHSNDRDEVVYATLEEAAKLTRMHGYRYFVILMAEDASHGGATKVPGLVLNYNRNARPAGTPIPGLQHLPSATFKTPDTSMPFITPGLMITIQMYREGEVDPGWQEVWNPEVILGPTASAR